MAEHIKDGRGEANAWGINTNNEGLVALSNAGSEITIDNPLPVTNFNFEVSKGNVDGHRTVFVLSNNILIGLTEEDVWDPGGVMVYPTTGEQLQFVSSSANDTSAGTGARTIEFLYLDEDYVPKSETITLSGTTAIFSTATDVFRFRAGQVKSAGTGAGNAGSIVITSSGAGNTRGIIQVGNNQTFNSHYTVPSGITSYLFNIITNVNKNEDVEVRLKRTFDGTNIFIPGTSLSVYQTTTNNDYPVNPEFREKSEVKLVAKSSNTSAVVFAEMQFVEVDN